MPYINSVGILHSGKGHVGPDPSRIEPIKSECFLAQGVTKLV